MIDTRSQYMIYKEQENGRMAQIESKLAAQERGGCAEKNHPGYFTAGLSLIKNVFSHTTVKPEPMACEGSC